LIITVFQVFTLSSFQPAVKILKPHHNPYITAAKYKNPNTLEIQSCITTSAESVLHFSLSSTPPTPIAAFT
jgi:hypothetical protein